MPERRVDRSLIVMASVVFALLVAWLVWDRVTTVSDLQSKAARWTEQEEWNRGMEGRVTRLERRR